ncbi:GroES-like protein [Aaosphaeria arxii CBS 175.79]|uniref:GroES-like protein n=1 Tax=Aaosphaeria arxii CBS 175.79 TaxID=1450172 RepID=A0A6A5Y3S6_9PLEO|nr:GroES-like protein [Aaosphaeria arxii CBS 175.79]KAF2019470.1 GroES-like protein [Aaosphaeria arxii CBS 175.79]
MIQVQDPQNRAAWMTEPKKATLDIKSTPYTPPGPGQMIIRNSALGINPIDWLKQMLGDGILGYVKYPIVLGEDIAGTVTAVGEGVTRFKVGDRVLAVGGAISNNDATQGGFQLYTRVNQSFTTPIPDYITFEQACALPLALLTASQGLFAKNQLNLDQPTVPARPRPDDVVIIAAGSSAVGSSAIQLAVSAGYQVISTSSPKNFDYVKALGASQVFDYKSSTLAEDILAAVKGRPLSGCYSIGNGTADIFASVIAAHAQDGSAPTSKRIALAEGKHSIEKDNSAGVEINFIINDISPEGPARHVFEQYLPAALAQRQFVPKPEPEVVGHGLEKLQDAFMIHKQGVSAKKIVITI